ncbi:MAG: patatin-like phospholipase family protein [Clostridiaceae bacterium]|nr:patatin-like phospholipase family protein [Clostridiaceae bacterium]
MYGLALEGGGVRGAFHMGAIKALIEEGYEFGGVTGTSIGALNGAIIAQGDFEAGYKLWEDMDAPLLFDIEEAQYKKLIDRRIDKELLLKLAARMKAIIENKGIDTGKMRQVIEGIVDEEKLRSSDTDFGLVTVSITDLKPLELYKEDIPEGKMIDYLMASASFPGFKLNPIGDKYFIDGGFYDNCPINLLARKGYKDIIAVRTLGIGIVQNVRYRNVNITNIVPSEDLGMLLDFNRDLIRRNLQMGYYDTMRSLKGLKGRKYYIIPENEDKVFDIFCKLSDTFLKELGILFKIKEMPVKRMLFESIIPELANLLDLKVASEYQDILIGLLEVLAEDSGVNKYKIYSMEEFIGEIKAYSEGKNKANIKRSRLKRERSLNKKLIDALKKKHKLRKAAKKIFDEVCSR